MLVNKESSIHRGLYKAILAEPCPVTRLGLRQVISSMPLRIERIAEIEQLSELQQCISQHQPDILITELEGDENSVLDVLCIISNCIRYGQYQMPVVVRTSIQSSPLFQLLRAINVHGICLKKEPIEVFTHCVERVLQGHLEFSPMVSKYLPEHKGYYAPLTEKELEIMIHLFSGNNVTTVAKLMSRDIRTISSHKRNAMRKIGFKNDGEMFSNSNWMELTLCDI